VLVAVRGDLTSSRYAIESALGAGCCLAALGDEDATEVLDLARGGWPTPATPCRRRSGSALTACPLAQGSARCR